MKKTLNKILKYFGFNVVKAKRTRKQTLSALVENHKGRAARNAKVVKDLVGSRPPYTEEELLASGKTHYVGDDCPGGHEAKNFTAECAEKVEHFSKPHITEPQACGVDNIFIGVPQQPNSDNDVKGPTA